MAAEGTPGASLSAWPGAGSGQPFTHPWRLGGPVLTVTELCLGASVSRPQVGVYGPASWVVAYHLLQQTGCPDRSLPEVQLPLPSHIAGTAWIPLSVTRRRRSGGFWRGRSPETWRPRGAVGDVRFPAPVPQTPGPGDGPRALGRHLPGLTPGRQCREDTALSAAVRRFGRDAHVRRRTWS